MMDKLDLAVGMKLRRLTAATPTSSWFESSPTYLDSWHKMEVGSVVEVTDVYTDPAAGFDFEAVAVVTDKNGIAAVLPLSFMTADNFIVVP